MESIQLVIDAIPAILAGIALFRFQQVSHRSPELYLAASAAALLIICQSSWIFSYIVNKPLVTTSVDYLWSAFNAIVMILAIRIIRGKHHE